MSSHHIYTDEEIRFLKNNITGKTRKELANAFNDNFGTKLSQSQIEQTARRYGLFFGKSPHRFSDDEREFIVKWHGKIPMKEIVVKFNKTFPEHQITYYGLRSYIQMTLKMRLYDKSIFSSFYRLNKKSLGSEHKRSGYILVKVDDRYGKKGTHIDRKNWKFKHRILWEKYYDMELPKGYQVVFLNGDKNDFSKDNLKAVPTKYLATMNRNKWLATKNADIAKAGFLWCELQDALKKGERK